MSKIVGAVNSIRAILANAKDIWEILHRVSIDPKVVMSETDISILSRRFVFSEMPVFEKSQVVSEFLVGDSWIFDQKADQICSSRCGYVSWSEDSGYVVASPIVIAKDNMSAYLVVPPKRMISRPITITILRDIYMHSGLKKEYDGGMESYLLSCWEKGGVFKISEGIFPTIARKRKFSFLINIVPYEDKMQLNSNRVPVVEVQEGDRIAKVISGEDYQEGMDVFGNLLSPEEVEGTDEQDEYQVGFGCHLAKDGNFLIASVTGVFVIDRDSKEYSVKDTFYLDRYVDSSYGSIQTQFSNIHITGSIKGVNIKSGGNLTILGKAEDVQISSQGKVIVKNGIQGISRICRVESLQSVESAFLSKTLVRSGTHVCIDSYIVDSEISSEGAVVVLSKEGKIVHSKISTSSWIGCQQIGSDEDKKSKSVFRIGYNSEEHEIRMRIDDHMHKLQEEVQKNRSALGEDFLQDPIGSMKKIPSKQHSDIRQKLADLKKFGTKLLQLQRHRDVLNQQELNWDEKKSGVVAFSKIFAGVSIYLEKYGPYIVQEDLLGAVYFKIDLGNKEFIVPAPLKFFASPLDLLPLREE